MELYIMEIVTTLLFSNIFETIDVHIPTFLVFTTIITSILMGFPDYN